MQQTIIAKTVTGSGMDSGDREKEKNPDTGSAHQAARQGERLVPFLSPRC